MHPPESSSSDDYQTAREETQQTRMTQTRRQFLGLVGAGAVASAAARPAAAQETPVVTMEKNYFDPVGLYVEPGTTVRFELAAGTHTATAYEDRVPEGATAFDSGILTEGSFEHTFEEPGTYDYYCAPHRSLGMVGRIVVGSPGGPAEDSPIPDGEVPSSETIVEERAVGAGSGSDGDWTGGGTMGGGMMGGGMMGGGMGHGGMMGHAGTGPGGMMGGRAGSWWFALPVVGWALALVAIVGGVLYALGGDSSETPTGDSAMETLRARYARGEIDEEEFRQRRDRLTDAGGDASS